MTNADGAAQGNDYFIWRLCAWSAPFFLVGYVATWGLIGFNLPTLDPGTPLNDLYAHYVEHSVRIRLGTVLCLIFAAFYLPFSSVMSRIMRSIEGPGGPLAILEQMGGVITVVELLLAPVCWMTAAYRVGERSPEIVRVLHDFGWLFFDTAYMPSSLQLFAMAYVFLRDKRAVPLMPNWVSWLCILAGIMFAPLTILPFVYTGPFGWSGLVCYWVSLYTWAVAIVVCSVHAVRAIRRLEREESGHAT